jgi:repressor LexA
MCGGDNPICNGDIAIIQQDVEISDRDICAVQVDGEEAALKRVHFHDGYVDLLPDNPDFTPTIHRVETVTIFGKLIYTMRRRG